MKEPIPPTKYRNPETDTELNSYLNISDYEKFDIFLSVNYTARYHSMYPQLLQVLWEIRNVHCDFSHVYA